MGPEAVGQAVSRITIVDYGMGNLGSVARAFESLNAEVEFARYPEQIENAERIVLPGVGAFGEGMRNLESRKLIAPLESAVLRRKVPFLGICLGMQLLAKESREQGMHKGLGWIPAIVRPFEPNSFGYKMIHIGWDPVVPTRPNFLFGATGIPYFYFVHGYHMDCNEPSSVCATSSYGKPFVSAILRDNIAGVQFHPEKSQEAGLGLLRNFMKWNPALAHVPAPETPKCSAPRTPNVRLIPTLLLHGNRLTKTVKFQVQTDGLRRDVGHPVKAPMVYDAQLADELILLDFQATQEGRDYKQLARAVSEIAGRAFMPLTAGGGIKETSDAQELLKAGADKVAINTGAVERNGILIRTCSEYFGSQCVVIAIDAKKVSGGWNVFTHGGTRDTGMDPADWANKAEKLGAGEILLTSIDRDGTMEGYDLELVCRVSEAVKIPVIASGGAGRLQDLTDAVGAGASAVAAASIFHFRDISPIKAKAFLKRTGLSIRD